MLLMEGKTPAGRIRDWVRRQVEELRTPLGVFRLLSLCVGDDPASEAYRRNQIRACEASGIETATVRLPSTATEQDARDRILEFNHDETVDGVILQTPLPPSWDVRKLREALDPDKDVEGTHPENLGRLFLGCTGHPLPCAAWSAALLLDWYGCGDLKGKVVAVVGQSATVGRPLSTLLFHRGATVVQIHEFTPPGRLEAFLKGAEVVAVAAGVPGLVRGASLSPGAWVVDVGTNPTPGKGLVGDVAPDAAGVVGALTPVPGGVGPLTVSLLLANLLLLATRRRAGRPVELPDLKELRSAP